MFEGAQQMESVQVTPTGRWVFIENSKVRPRHGLKTVRSLYWYIAKEMKPSESMIFGKSEHADKLRNAIRHQYGNGSACMAKENGHGWRVWRVK